MLVPATLLATIDGLLLPARCSCCCCCCWISLPERLESVVALLNPFLTRVRIVCDHDCCPLAFGMDSLRRLARCPLRTLFKNEIFFLKFPSSSLNRKKWASLKCGCWLTHKEALVTSCLWRMRVTVHAGSSGSLISIHSSLVSLRRSAPVRVDVDVPAKLGAGESGTAPLPIWVNL